MNTTTIKSARSLAVVVGIDNYQNGIDRLNTAVSDAVEIAQTLKDTYDYTLINPDFDSKAIINSYATKEKLKTLLTDILPNEIKQTKSDRLIFYFAGHGIARNSDKGPQGYLVPQDAERKNPDSLLRMSDVHDWLVKLECKHLLVILDCCFAGAFRWASYRTAIPINLSITQAHYDRFIKFPAWQVLTSASHNQESLDFLNNRDRDIKPDRQHSPFTEGLIKALQGEADLNKDGVIIATELYLYLRDYVELNSEYRQTPGIFPLKKHDRGEYVFLLPNFKREELPPTPKLNKENNPYRGLKPFEEKHAPLFFGRRELINNLFIKVSQPNHCITVVSGISGSGKSSLVKAGLIPYLRPLEKRSIYKLSLICAYISTLTIIKKFSCLPIKFLPINYIHRWVVLEPIRPGRNPFNSLERGLSALDKDSENSENPIKLIQNWSQKHPNHRILLVIDQFEEIITFATKSKETITNQEKSWWQKLKEKLKFSKVERERNNLEEESEEWQKFTKLLATILQKCPQLSLVVTLRSDFEPRFQESAFSSDWANARFLMRPMRSDELREAVEKPAAEKALYFEPPELVDRLVDEVFQMPGALPLLSFTLSEMYIKLYEAWVKNGEENRALTVAKDFEQEGGVAGALTRRANEEYEKLRLIPFISCLLLLKSKQYNLCTLLLVEHWLFLCQCSITMRRVMLRMVELKAGEAVRRRILKSELVYPDPKENKRVEIVLRSLVNARLIVTGTDTETNKQYYEPAHDFLVMGWNKLQEWIDKAQKNNDLVLQKRLTPAAIEWDRLSDSYQTNIFDKADFVLTKMDRVIFPIEKLLFRFIKIPAYLIKWLQISSEQQGELLISPRQLLWNTNPYLDVLELIPKEKIK